MNKDQAATDLELFIARFLRAGVIFAGGWLTIGWLGLLLSGQSSLVAFTNYQPTSLAKAIAAAYAQGSYSILCAYFGLGCLISLPIIRVVLTLFVFLRQKEFAMAALAALVLGGLALSLALGFRV